MSIMPADEHEILETPARSILLTVPVPHNEEELTKAFWDDTGTALITQANQYAEVGRFQIILLIVCLIAYSTTSTVPNILTTSANAIQCDYQLIVEDRRAINDIVYVCMILGGAAWSLVADTLSRKWALVFALLVYALATFGLTLAPTFTLFGLCRGIGAFSLSGIQCMIITFIAEFQIRIFRGSMICCLQLAWVIGMVTIPILPYTWKQQILLAVFPPIVAMIGFLFFPDSSRFLLSRGREKAALNSLRMIHGFNTGNWENFPIRHLRDNKSPAEIRNTSIVKNYIPSHLEPKFICIPMLMFSQFVIMFSYYSLALWFPGMATRSDAFFPLKRVEDIPQDCKVGLYRQYESNIEPVQTTTVPPNVDFIQGYNAETRPHKAFFRVIDAQPENPCEKDRGQPFVSKTRVMDALACMPSLIWIVVKIDSIGRKFFITFSHVLAGCLVFASYFMHSAAKGLLFACLFDSLVILSVATAQCLAVELFPTRVRVLGVALVLGAGQLGAILADIGGAISFGLTCVVVVALIALALATSGVLMMTLPDTTGIALK